MNSMLLIEVQGEQGVRFFQICVHEGLNISNIEWKDKSKWTCMIRAKDFFQLKRIRRKTKVSVRILEKKGFIFREVIRQKFVIFLACIGIGIVLCMSQMVCRIRINGNERIPSSEIAEWLNEHGCTKWSYIKDIDTGDVERAIWRDFDEIAWLTVYIEDNTLYVEIEEKIAYE